MAANETASPDTDPLDGLESVDWGSLQHAYGSAEDVPDLYVISDVGVEGRRLVVGRSNPS